MHGEPEAIDGVDSFVVCCRVARGGLAVVCLEEHVGLFIDVCITKVESSEAAHMIEKTNLESA